MMDIGYFEDVVHQYFDSLFLKYGYSYAGNEESERDIYCYFKRPDRLVRVHYNRPNRYIDIDFYKETDVTKLLGADSISLEHILKDNNYDIMVYKGIMPGIIDIDESLKRLLELMNKHALEYLDGNKWKSWREIMNR